MMSRKYLDQEVGAEVAPRERQKSLRGQLNILEVTGTYCYAVLSNMAAIYEYWHLTWGWSKLMCAANPALGQPRLHESLLT